MSNQSNRNIDVENIYGTDINKLWNNQKFKEISVIHRGYAIPKKIIENALMFVGINPSYSDINNENECFFYELEQQGKGHKYFKKFKEISKEINMPWAHIDLLFLKERKQEKIEKLYSEKNGTEFIFEQLKISKKILESAKPKIIVVNNTLSRKYLGFEKDIEKSKDIWIGLDFSFDDEIGTHRIRNNESLEDVPVFFTSMLTGQRALDKGSLERLIWHIKFIDEKLNSKLKLSAT